MIIQPDSLEGEMRRIWSSEEAAAMQAFATDLGMTVEEVMLEHGKAPGGVADQVGVPVEAYTAELAALVLAAKRRPECAHLQQAARRMYEAARAGRTG